MCRIYIPPQSWARRRAKKNILLTLALTLGQFDSGDPPPPTEDSDSDVVIDIYEADGDVSTTVTPANRTILSTRKKNIFLETPRKGNATGTITTMVVGSIGTIADKTGRKSRQNPVTMRCQKFHQSCPPQARSDPLGRYAARIDPVLTLMQHRN